MAKARTPDLPLALRFYMGVIIGQAGVQALPHSLIEPLNHHVVLSFPANTHPIDNSPTHTNLCIRKGNAGLPRATCRYRFL